MSSVLDVVKPHRNEALIRLRSSALCLVGVVIVTFLSPLPSIPGALLLWIRDNSDTNDELHSILKLIAGIELGVVSLLLLTILQAGFALKFPRKPAPLPAKTPLKPVKNTQASRRVGPLSPHTSPQPQKTYSPNVSLSRSLGNSVSSTPATPSPLAAYAGKHSDAGLGRSLDGSFIRRLAAEISDDEE